MHYLFECFKNFALATYAEIPIQKLLYICGVLPFFNNVVVPLELFLKFNKLKELQVTTADISKSISNFSKLLTLNELQDKVKRSTPLVAKDNLDSLIVYLVCY